MFGFFPQRQGHKGCVADYILFWEELDDPSRLMIVIKKLKVFLNDVLNINKKPGMLPFMTGQEEWASEFLRNVFICKEAFGALFVIGQI